MPRIHKYTRQKLLNLARKLATEYGESLTLTAFRRETGFSQHLIFDLFESWCELRTEIGLTPEASRGRNKVPAEMIQIKLQEAVAEHGPNLSEVRFCQMTGLSGGTITRRCGSWGQLRESIGLSPRAVVQPQYTDQQLMEDLFQVICRCRCFPPFHQYKRLGGRISAMTIRDRYGSWPLTANAFEDYKTELFKIGPSKYYERAEDRWNPSGEPPPQSTATAVR